MRSYHMYTPSGVGKLFGITFSSEQKKPCLKTGKSLSSNQNLSSVHEKITQMHSYNYISSVFSPSFGVFGAYLLYLLSIFWKSQIIHLLTKRNYCKLYCTEQEGLIFTVQEGQES